MPGTAPEGNGSSLLAPSNYDNDVSSFHSGRLSDSEDDKITPGVQTSLELAEYDRAVLEEEEERENLLVSQSSGEGHRGIVNGGNDHGSQVRIGRRKRQRKRKATKRRNGRRDDEQGELMYEMEEGGQKDDASSESSSSSSELDRQKLHDVFTGRPRRSRCLQLTAINAVIAFLFAFLVYGAYHVSRRPQTQSFVSVLSNGTSTFAPTTILISLDGFRADFLNRGLTPTLNSFIAEGVSPKYMLPSFPSVTFPNHYTLVTGLYPESHGVVGNTFWDPELQEEFFYTDPRSMQPKWWAGAEPLWVTAEKQNVRSAIHMWPGSEAHMEIEPTFVDKYNGSEGLSRKVQRIFDFLDFPSAQDSGNDSPTAQRPQFIAAYVPVVDSDGHLYGPNSTEIRKTIQDVDTMLHDIFVGLERRNLTKVVNIVVVSDHGMATTSTDRLIQMDDLIDLDLVEHIDGWPLYGLRPKDSIDLRGLYDRLSVESAQNPGFEVYLRDENMPERYHFKNNDRIAPLWIIPTTGWAIVSRQEMDVKEAKESGEIYHPRGLHGYDHEHPLMRAIFVARGPAFPHAPNSRLEVFQNTEVYNIICDSLSVVPHPNNGTLHLPFRPVGLHSDDPIPADDVPADFSAYAENKSSPSTSTSTDEPSTVPTRPVISGGENADEGISDEEEEKKELSKWWAYVITKIEAAKAWAAGITAKIHKGTTEPANESRP